MEDLITQSSLNQEIPFDNVSSTYMYNNKNVISTTYLPVYGVPGHVFWLIHITGLTSLSLSLLVSGALLLNLLFFPLKNPWKRPIGERLVIYLAVCDFGWSSSHIMDHIYMMVIVDHVPDIPCAIFGFLLAEFMTSQALVILFTSLNAFLLVVKEVKISLGPYDWKLVTVAFGLPFAFWLPFCTLGFLGPSGAWCLIDLRDHNALILNYAVTSILLVTFLVNFVSYLLVFAKLGNVTQKSTLTTANAQRQKKYHRTARIMMLFVLAFLLQWVFVIIHSIWSLCAFPHVAIVALTVFFANMGGVFNFFAYTWMRKKQGSTTDAENGDTRVTNT